MSILITLLIIQKLIIMPNGRNSVARGKAAICHRYVLLWQTSNNEI